MPSCRVVFENLPRLPLRSSSVAAYARMLAKRARNDPFHTLTSLPRWTTYLFVPRLARSRTGGPVLSCVEVDEAAEVFRRDGYVVLSDALTEAEAAALGRLVESKAEEVVRLEDAGALPGRDPSRDPKRYSFSDYGPCPEWEYLSCHEPVLAVLRKIWSHQAFAAWTAGGDFVMPGGTWQQLHSDFGQALPGGAVPPVLIVDYYVSDVLPTNGPIRQVPGTARFPPPGDIARRSEPIWMQRSVITGRPGFALIRDPRGWHGGTQNTSSEPRYMPDVVYVRRDASLTGVPAILKMPHPHHGSWIAEFSNP